MPRIIRYLLVADSRAFSFNKYSKPVGSNIAIDFVIHRGATVDDLLLPTLARLRTYPLEDRIIIKLAAGINNLLAF